MNTEYTYENYYCCENYEDEKVCENCGKRILQEDYLGMLPSFTYSAIPVIKKKIQRRDRNGKIRVVDAEYAIPFPAAFQVAARLPGGLKPKSCQSGFRPRATGFL